jgi:hypothetical protein
LSNWAIARLLFVSKKMSAIASQNCSSHYFNLFPMTSIHLPQARKRFKRRSLFFHVHRWLGLTAGILLCIAGLTGSILVFWHEIDHWWLVQRFGAINPKIKNCNCD